MRKRRKMKMTPEERAEWEARHEDLGRRLQERLDHHERALAAAGRPVDRSKDIETRVRERIAARRALFERRRPAEG